MRLHEGRPYRIDAGWNDWKWQQSNAVRDVQALRRAFPSLDSDTCARIEQNNSVVRFQVTPYLLSLIARKPDGSPDQSDPIWLQYIPSY